MTGSSSGRPQPAIWLASKRTCPLGHLGAAHGILLALLLHFLLLPAEPHAHEPAWLPSTESAAVPATGRHLAQVISDVLCMHMHVHEDVHERVWRAGRGSWLAILS
jgi:hypothetical protein